VIPANVKRPMVDVSAIPTDILTPPGACMRLEIGATRDGSEVWDVSDGAVVPYTMGMVDPGRGVPQSHSK